MTADCIHLSRERWPREGVVMVVVVTGWNAADARIRDTDTGHEPTLPSTLRRGDTLLPLYQSLVRIVASMTDIVRVSRR
jgi:hypothetical protein